MANKIGYLIVESYGEYSDWVHNNVSFYTSKEKAEEEIVRLGLEDLKRNEVAKWITEQSESFIDDYVKKNPEPKSKTVGWDLIRSPDYSEWYGKKSNAARTAWLQFGTDAITKFDIAEDSPLFKDISNGGYISEVYEIDRYRIEEVDIKE